MREPLPFGINCSGKIIYRTWENHCHWTIAGFQSSLQERSPSTSSFWDIGPSLRPASRSSRWDVSWGASDLSDLYKGLKAKLVLESTDISNGWVGISWDSMECSWLSTGTSYHHEETGKNTVEIRWIPCCNSSEGCTKPYLSSPAQNDENQLLSRPIMDTNSKFSISNRLYNKTMYTVKSHHLYI